LLTEGSLVAEQTENEPNLPLRSLQTNQLFAAKTSIVERTISAAQEI
jgi:hypothetical protein